MNTKTIVRGIYHYIEALQGRQGSQFAIALFCDVASGTHLDIRPNR